MTFRIVKVEGLLVGPRFHLNIEDSRTFTEANQIRAGAGPSFVVDKMPISGPIVLVTHAKVPSSVTQTWWGSCTLCGEESKPYRRPGDANLRLWAHRHRCEPLFTPPEELL